MAEEELIKKTPPHSKSAEQSVLGSMLLDPETVITVSEMLEADDFFDKRYGLIFSAIISLEKEGKPIDIVTIENKIREMEHPLGAIEIDVLRELLLAVPTSVNVAHYAEIVYATQESPHWRMSYSLQKRRCLICFKSAMYLILPT